MASAGTLAARIAQRRRVHDEAFQNELRAMRKRHGDAVIDQALAEMRAQQAEREAVTASRNHERGPRHVLRDGGPSKYG
jgi:hypothetical protein